jgi:hypothetical protein
VIRVGWVARSGASMWTTDAPMSVRARMRVCNRHHPPKLCFWRRQWCEDDLLSSVQTRSGRVSPGERRLCPRTVLKTMRGKRSRCVQLTYARSNRPRRRCWSRWRSEECARCRALWAPAGCALRLPLGRTEDVPCGTDVMTPTYSCAIRTSTSERPSHEPPSRKSQARAARRRRQCPKARRPAGSKRSGEH